MNNKKIFKLLEEQNRITKNGLIKCNCGRKVKIDNITFIYPIDVNYFDWWMYEWLDNGEHKLIPKYWYGYIGYIPILRDIVYRGYKIFHKKAYVLDIECKYCKGK